MERKDTRHWTYQGSNERWGRAREDVERAPRGTPEYCLYLAGQGQLAEQDLSPYSVMGPEHCARYRAHSALHQCQEARGKRTMGRG